MSAQEAATDFEIIEGDVRAMLDLLPPGSVHMAVTSVPYWKLRRYMKQGAKGARFEIGSEPTFEEWLEVMVDVFERVKRVLRPDGTLWLNTGDSYNTNEHGPNGRGRLNRFSESVYKKGSGRGRCANLKHKDMIGQPWSLAFALRDAGWWLRSEIIWSKVNPLPEHFDRPAKAHEQIFVLSKTDRCYGEEDFDHEHFFLLSKTARPFYDKIAVREPASENTHPRGANRTPKSLTADPDTTLSAHGFMFAGVSKTRNCRTVWTFPTRAAAEGSDHHATFPVELPERCIRAGTSERGVCADCGAPWLRQTTKASGGSIGKWHPHEDDEVTGNVKCSTKGYEPPKTIGWRSSCDCGAPPIPATVLDPFSGTATTGVAALKLGRSFVGIELNAQSARFSRGRLARAADEFAAPIFEKTAAAPEQRALFEEASHG